MNSILPKGKCPRRRSGHCWLLLIAAILLAGAAKAAPQGFVLNNGAGTLSVVDLNTKSVSTFNIGATPTDIQFSNDNRTAYVPLESSNSVAIVDLVSHSLLGEIPVGTQPVALLLSRDGRRGFVANSGSNTVTAFDCATLHVLNTIPVGTSPVSLNLDYSGIWLYVTNQDSNDITVINSASLTVSTTIPVGQAPNQFALSPDLKTAVAINTGSNNLSIVDLSTFSVLKTITVGKSPVGVAFDVDGKTLLVTCRDANTVDKVDLTKGIVAASWPVGMAPVGIALTSDGHYAYVADSGSNDVMVLDTVDPSNNDFIPVGRTPFSVTFDPNEDFVYVTNLGQGTVSVIDPNTDKVVKTLSTGDSPFLFSFLNAPTFLGISQTAGATGGGTHLQIAGRGFVEGIQVDLGGSLATITSFSPYELQITTGNHSAGTAAVNLTNPDKSSDSWNGFVYQPASSTFSINFPTSLDSSAFRTNLGVNVLANVTATAAVSLLDAQGSVLATSSLPLSPYGLMQQNNINRWLLNQTAVTDTSGSLQVDSAQPIAGFVSIIDNLSQDSSIEQSGTLGRSHWLIPSVTNVGRYRSNLAIQNLSNAAATLTLKFFDTGGNLLGSRSNVSIPPLGNWVQDDIVSYVGVNGNYGPLEIEAPDGISIIATSRVYSNSDVGGTSGGFLEGRDPSAASKDLLLPFVVDTVDFRTNLGINNPGTASATAVVILLDSQGQQIGSGTVTIPAKGMTQTNSIVRKLVNNPAGGPLSAVADPGTPANQQGSLHIMATQPMLAWASQIDNISSDPSLENGLPAGFSLLWLPSSTNTGLFRSSLTLVNTEPTIAEVLIKAHDVNGTVIALKQISLPANGQWHELDILGSMGLSDQYGPLEISSANGVPLIATSRVYSTSHTSSFFEARPIW